MFGADLFKGDAGLSLSWETLAKPRPDLESGADIYTLLGERRNLPLPAPDPIRVTRSGIRPSAAEVGAGSSGHPSPGIRTGFSGAPPPARLRTRRSRRRRFNWHVPLAAHQRAQNQRHHRQPRPADKRHLVPKGLPEDSARHRQRHRRHVIHRLSRHQAWTQIVRPHQDAPQVRRDPHLRAEKQVVQDVQHKQHAQPRHHRVPHKIAASAPNAITRIGRSPTRSISRPKK